MADESEGAAATAEPAVTPELKAETLGDGGKAALEAERKARKAAEKQARDAQAQLDKLADANQSEQERAIAKAVKEATDAAKAEVTNDFRSKLLNAEIRAQAAGKFANPDLATRVLDIDADDVFDDDGIKKDAVSKAVDDFLALDANAGLKADPSNGRPVGDADAGKGAGASGAQSPEQAHNDWLLGLVRGA